MAEHSHRPQARRSFLRLAGAAGLAVALAGCQIVPGGSRGQQAPLPPPDPEREAPLTLQTPHKVAVLVPLAGPNGGVGTSLSNAANLALADARGERLQLTVYDTSAGAAAAAERALAEGNRLFLGPLLSEDVRAVAPRARRAQVPVISFSNDVSVAGNGVYIMGFNPAQSIERVVRYARGQGVQRFAGLIPEGDYGVRSGQALARAVEGSGGRLVASQTFGRTPAALRSAAIRLNAQSPYDAVLIADNGRIAMSAATTIRSGPSNTARILGTELWRNETALAGSVPMRGAWFASVPNGMFDQLRTRYRARYGKIPYRLGSLGYDAVLLSVRISNEWRQGRPFPERELRNPEGFMGVDGAFRFGSDGVAERQLEVLEVRAGSFTPVSPALGSFAR
ncbi:MAG: penicillin-binding protein activator [Pseudomonadota bacterium]|nr:penicillin-binding protein activator [Pseudomonadota bacterium]